MKRRQRGRRKSPRLVFFPNREEASISRRVEADKGRRLEVTEELFEEWLERVEDGKRYNKSRRALSSNSFFESDSIKSLNSECIPTFQSKTNTVNLTTNKEPPAEK